MKPPRLVDLNLVQEYIGTKVDKIRSKCMACNKECPVSASLSWGIREQLNTMYRQGKLLDTSLPLSVRERLTQQVRKRREQMDSVLKLLEKK